MLRTGGDCAAATRGAAEGPLGDGQVDHPAGALGEIGGKHAEHEAGGRRGPEGLIVELAERLDGAAG